MTDASIPTAPAVPEHGKRVSLMEPDVALSKLMIISAVLLVFGCIAVTRKQFVLAS